MSSGFIVRVGIDQTERSGMWNAPMHPNGDFVFVPIRDHDYNPGGTYIPGGKRLFREVEPDLRMYGSAIGQLEHPGLILPDALRRLPMHLDPDFYELTYGDQRRRGSGISKATAGDFLAFYAALRRITDRVLVYALIGFFRIASAPEAASGVIALRERLKNAHTRWRTPHVGDLVLHAVEQQSGLLSVCIPIGGWRDGAYRVFPELLQRWGGLDVKDGYIQRSARIPRFLNPSKFESWFYSHQPVLERAQFRVSSRAFRAQCSGG